jgi:hypothetical protein
VPLTQLETPTSELWTLLTDDPFSALDWTSISALFDKYRVCAIKIKWVPGMSVSTALNNNAILNLYQLSMIHRPDDGGSKNL